MLKSKVRKGKIMTKIIDFGSRKKAVLAAAINRYIKDAMPVASEDIAEDFGVSSATIRNIFKELEEDGFLKHPYTSGGKIPTSKGYRYYVDFLVSQMALVDEEKANIVKEYTLAVKKLEDILEITSDLLSTLTRYAGIVSLSDDDKILIYKGLSFILEQPEFQDTSRIRCLIKTIEDKHRILNIVNRDFSEKVRVYIGEELECPEIEECSLVVSSYSVRKKPSGKIAVLGPKRMEYTHIIPALDYISDILSDTLDEI